MKTNNVDSLSVWAKEFFDAFIVPFEKIHGKIRVKNFAKKINDITIENGKVIGIHEDKYGKKIITELLFKISRDNDRILSGFKASSDIIDDLNRSSVQLELNRAFIDNNIDFEFGWLDIKITCSCGFFDYLDPCWHVVGLFMKIVYEINNDAKKFLKIQGVDLNNINNVQKTHSNIIDFTKYLASKVTARNESINEKLPEINETILIEATNFNDNISNNEKNKKDVIFDENIDPNEDATITEQGAIYKSRIGQSKFKNKLLIKYKKCLLCDITLQDILVASHIKPWSESNDKDRLDVNNGLLLCALHDKLFDLGFISFNNDGTIIVSNEIKREAYTELKIDSNIKIDINERMEKFIIWHRENIFK